MAAGKQAKNPTVRVTPNVHADLKAWCDGQNPKVSIEAAVTGFALTVIKMNDKTLTTLLSGGLNPKDVPAVAKLALDRLALAPVNPLTPQDGGQKQKGRNLIRKVAKSKVPRPSPGRKKGAGA